jgi:hypothetical protein
VRAGSAEERKKKPKKKKKKNKKKKATKSRAAETLVCRKRRVWAALDGAGRLVALGEGMRMAKRGRRAGTGGMAAAGGEMGGREGRREERVN